MTEESNYEVAKFDMSFGFEEHSEGMYYSLNYNTNIYSKEQVDQMLSHLEQLLGTISTQPQASISGYEILTQEEKTYLLETLNDTKADYPRDKTIVDLFEEQVEKAPDSVAIKFKGAELTYRELNEQSNQLSHYLIKQYSIQPDELVGIELERSEWMVIGILAIIKSGGAYVPIDPEYPKQRKNYLIKNSGCKFVINAKVIKAFKNASNENVAEINIKNKGLLCCIYTSGSSGLPKGVMISHQNLMNRIYWMWTKYPFQANEVTAIKTAIGFVDHLWELFGSLLSGVKSVIISQDDVKEVDKFAGIIDFEKITRLVLVPSLLKFILTQEEIRNQFLSVKLWTVSGEVLHIDLVSLFYKYFATARLLNIYGSTEITADVTFFDTGTMILEEGDFTPELFKAIDEEDKYAKNLMEDILVNPIHNGNFDASNIYEDDNSTNVLSQYLEGIDTVIKKNVININSKYFIGHMTGPIPPLLYLVHQKMVQMNQNQVKLETSGIGTSLEKMVVGFFHKEVFAESKEFYLEYETKNETSLGIITSGGTLSNISALQLALSKKMNELLLDEGVTLQETGLTEALKITGFNKVVILASSLHHYSIHKAAKLMGLGTNAVISFSSSDIDNLNKLVSELIQEKKLIIALVGVAGTTESGEVDSLEQLSKLCKQNLIHYHVDAAFGGAFLLSSYRNVLSGIHEADSVSICGHKQLYTPVGCSLILFKSPYLVRYSEHNARYQARKGSADLGKFTNEGTRPFTALTLDAVSKLHLNGYYEQVLDNLIGKANWMYRFLRQFNFIELYAPPTLNILLFRYIPEEYITKHNSFTLSEEDRLDINQINSELQQEQFLEGKFFVSQTRLKEGSMYEKVWLRVVLMNPFTSQKDIQKIIFDQFLKLGFNVANKRYLYHSLVPIGKPISNTKILILDDRKKIQPIGVMGEICVVGDAVAMNYIENEKKEGYIKNPFNNSQSMFCTGDMGYITRDGNLMYKGRVDEQIKILGNRINVSELRRVVLEIKEISDVLVINQDDQLILFVEGAEFLKKDILRKIRLELPIFMKPSRILFLTKFILNNNGKLDNLKMIELLNDNQPNEIDIFEGTWLDDQLQKIWSKVLDKEENQIPFNKDFFELGGNSLKLISLVSTINRTFGKHFRFRDLLTVPTIQEIRELINRDNSSE
ncbi:AMP-binding protein [Polaribacter sp.]|nr:AMP-binding protein [Polaribacter sp.]